MDKDTFRDEPLKIFSIYIINICSLHNALTNHFIFHLLIHLQIIPQQYLSFMQACSRGRGRWIKCINSTFSPITLHSDKIFDYPRLRISTRLLKGVEERVWLNYFHFSFSEKLTAQWDWENVCLILDIWTVLKRYPDTVMVSPAFDGFSPGAAIQMLCVGDVMLWSVSQCLHADAGRAVVTM